MAKAFLSHSSTDKNLIEKIATQLGRNNCHYDRFTFEVGNVTLEEIITALDNSDIFVLFISETALESKWVKEEITKAKKNLDRGIIDRIYPIIIDGNITYKDPRIPKWIRRPYNLQKLDNEVLILRKIKQALREVEFKRNSKNRELNDLFVGRHDLSAEFERKIINIDNKKPTCVVAYNYFEGMGRRTFLKNALIKTNIVNKLYEPEIIPIDSKESIEDFIYKLNLINPDEDIYKKDLAIATVNEKVEIAKNLVKTFIDNNEILFIVDEGSLILPNNKIVDWFEKLIASKEFENQICFCIISKFKPDGFQILKLGNIEVFRIPELSKTDTTTLFLQYLNTLDIQITAQDKTFFLDHLKGLPAQVIYTAQLIAHTNLLEAKKHIEDIVEYSDLMALSIFEFFKNDEFAQQLLIILSKFEIINIEYIYKILGDENAVNDSVQSLYDLSVFNFMFSGFEYIKLNTGISDYISRSRLTLKSDYNNRLKQLVTESLSKDLDSQIQTDYSEFLFTLQNMIHNGINIPSKYFLPSFVIKSVVREYGNGKYDIAINLSSQLLETSNHFDEQIIREARYWFCLACSRLQNDKFFDEINYFKNEYGSNKDYYFLLGFYYRNGNQMDEAEDFYLKVLEIDKDHSKTKRELVNVYLKQGDYIKALNLAEENFYRFRTNILHAQAYFTCLVKKYKLTSNDVAELDMLLETVKKSFNKKAQDIHRTMQGEYEFYVNHKLDKAIKLLTLSLQLDKHKNYAFRSLKEIYRKMDMQNAIDNLYRDFANKVDTEDDEY
ncbi:toll/interleukin-1 receptor domain-containing protein [Mucilaginibacter conchicola]|uniref:Toll/interleukin-1 receptor domain-containing protein n=1 Tax=Mucilaginibacter conchicola TaxID=2303333 RepID=A0A372NQ40_9SPHI|nr:toll/interleukin-1 receptor domain-containing protein [Mucilaginibacter conchicola]RFZ90747.1 toll/interleukin-1 receptor domain-containing protein [Mucilaginibacter conchicola]